MKTTPTKRKTTKTVETPKPARRGFSAMDPKLQLKIATMGGKTVSKNRKHMAMIGAMGGRNSHRNTNPKGN